MRISQIEIKKILSEYDVFTDKDLGQRFFQGHETEIREYMHESTQRFSFILSLLEKEFSHKKRLKILEIGADPFGLTALILELWGSRVELFCAVRSSEVWPGHSNLMERKHYWIKSASRVFKVPACEFNVERATFPFQDKSFDLVLFTSVIEMLIYSPTHAIMQIHRVLKKDGVLILNTPNALKIQRLFRHLLNMRSEFPYSGYGVYGRPNRLFTLPELEKLLQGCNYEIVEKRAITLSRSYDDWRKRLPWKFIKISTLLPIPYLVNKRDQIFIVSRSTGEAKAYYPDSIYASSHNT